MASDEAVTYAAAGVDIEAGDLAVGLMKEWVAKTRRPEVVDGLGGFAGLFDASALTNYQRPYLATSTDGVGTKVAIAQRTDVHDTIGIDLVAMVVDDIVVCGAEPLFLTDYIACGKVVPERIASIVKGIAAGCAHAGCALLGGETAEHPGLLEPHEYDLAGAATGVVEAGALLGPDRVRAGDTVVAMASSGLHSNGYSLVRHVFFDRMGWDVHRHVPELGRTLGEELLTPTTVYARACLDLATAVETHGFAHITGGGLAANISRAIPPGLGVTVDRASWTPQPVFDVIADVGELGRDVLEHALNMGVGMVAIVAPEDSDRAVRRLADHGVEAWVAGEVHTGDGAAHMIGDYAG